MRQNKMTILSMIFGAFLGANLWCANNIEGGFAVLNAIVAGFMTPMYIGSLVEIVILNYENRDNYKPINCNKIKNWISKLKHKNDPVELPHKKVDIDF